jgi:hypothetical protein
MAVFNSDIQLVEGTETGLYTVLREQMVGFATDTRKLIYKHQGGTGISKFIPESQQSLYGATGISGERGAVGYTGLQGTITNYVESGFTGSIQGLVGEQYPWIDYTLMLDKIVHMNIPAFTGISDLSILRIRDLPAAITPTTDQLTIACPGMTTWSDESQLWTGPAYIAFDQPENYLIMYIGQAWSETGIKGLLNPISITYMV